MGKEEIVTHNDDRGYLTELVTALDSEQVSAIDFDRMRDWLRGLSGRLAVHEQTSRDLARLRQDAEARTGGMIKAIAAADQKRGNWETALREAESLPTLSVGELLEYRQRVAAKFRDCFPTSFGYLSRIATRGERPGAYGDFK